MMKRLHLILAGVLTICTTAIAVPIRNEFQMLLFENATSYTQLCERCKDLSIGTCPENFGLVHYEWLSHHNVTLYCREWLPQSNCIMLVLKPLKSTDVDIICLLPEVNGNRVYRSASNEIEDADIAAAVAENPEAAVEKPDAVGENPDIVTENPDAGPKEPDPVAKETEPVEPMAEEPEAVAEIADAVAENPVAVDELLEPVAEELEVVAEEPKAIAEVPEPIADEANATEETGQKVTDGKEAVEKEQPVGTESSATDTVVQGSNSKLEDVIELPPPEPMAAVSELSPPSEFISPATADEGNEPKQSPSTAADTVPDSMDKKGTDSEQTPPTPKPIQSCYSCTSSSGDSACHTKPTKIVNCPVSPSGNSEQSNGCFTVLKYETNTTERGCLSDLTMEGQKFCKKQAKLCQLCYEAECNHLPAPSSAASYLGNVLSIILYLVLSINLRVT